MNNPNTLYVSNREAWRHWLQANYQTATEIWLVYPRQHTGRPRIAYNDAVEEALCFGWIDSITRTIDEDHFSQRFTPRQPRSSYSQTNIERLRRLVSQEKVLPEVLAALGDLLEQAFVFPPDIEAALRANEQVWANFQRYSAAYQRIRVAYVESRRGKPEEFEKRLNHLLKMTAQDKQFGFGIEGYY
ncbi:MAG: YdeI/OmpD-associated family protein [Ardenticatenaceae bacterium]|nr:YdeI/OmpD-associated family protein [Ardenticatenaceae bacterium]